jgi:hypothetical protein
MTDQVLNILKYVLLGLLYLFFARVLWAVWSEVKAPVRRWSPDGRVQPGQTNIDPSAPTTPATRPATPATRPAAPAVTPAVTGAAAGKKRSRRASRRAPAAPTQLVVLEPAARRGTTVALGGEVTLGRDPGCRIVIDDDAFISQHHLRIFDYDGQPMIEDLGSTNGTYHNGVKLIGAKLLRAGDRVQVGTTVIEAR